MARPQYEAPKVTLIGNTRDLLAGSTGSIEDGIPLPGQETQPGG